MNPPFAVQPSSIAGVGVFALQDIPKDLCLHCMEGEPIDLDGIIARVQAGEEAPSDPFQVEDDLFLDLEEVSRSFNHSCHPNVVVRGRNELVTIRPIQKGEEITYDYATTMRYDRERILASGNEMWSCTCLCGAANCRGIIHEFRTLPKHIQRYYIENRYLPDFLLRHHSDPSS